MTEHTHSHDHDHDQGDTYFIDQLCMVALCGAFGAVCLCLWFWQPTPPKPAMLTLILGEQFHAYILASGIALTFLTLAQASSCGENPRSEFHEKARSPRPRS